MRLGFSHKSLLRRHRAIQAFSLQSRVTVELISELSHFLWLLFMDRADRVREPLRLTSGASIFPGKKHVSAGLEGLLLVPETSRVCGRSYLELFILLFLFLSRRMSSVLQGLSRQSLGGYQETGRDMPAFSIWLRREPLLL